MKQLLLFAAMSQSLVLRGTSWNMLAYLLILQTAKEKVTSQSLLFGLGSSRTTSSTGARWLSAFASLQPTRISFQNKILVAFTCRNEVQEGSLLVGLCSPIDNNFLAVWYYESQSLVIGLYSPTGIVASVNMMVHSRSP
jgi:hypothetical protein